ncbi:MAG: hypothetical protein KTR31_12810 [Myxococcales bacterium]|nr:hypothetical protein [Myxococcales bacterium]
MSESRWRAPNRWGGLAGLVASLALGGILVPWLSSLDLLALPAIAYVGALGALSATWMLSPTREVALACSLLSLANVLVSVLPATGRALFSLVHFFNSDFAEPQNNDAILALWAIVLIASLIQVVAAVLAGWPSRASGSR